MDSLTAVLAAIVGPVVRDAVLDALAELSHNEKNSRVLLNRADLARALGVSIATVARLRAEGVPCLLVGDSPRFCLEAVVPWLEARSLQRQDGAL
jgi:hypothetical protein